MNRSRYLVAVAPLVYALVACSSGTQSSSEDIAPKWADMVQQVLSDAPSDFERKALSDSEVSDAEYREAQELFRQCMADKAWVVSFSPGGGYVVQPGPENPDQAMETIDADNAQCGEGTTDGIEPIYLGMKENPQGLSSAQLIRACYERQGVEDGKELTAAEFEELVTDPSYHASTPAGKVCFFDPSGTVGISEQEAEEMDQNRKESGAETDVNGNLSTDQP